MFKLSSIELNQKFKVRVFIFFFVGVKTRLKEILYIIFFFGGPGQGVHLNPLGCSWSRPWCYLFPLIHKIYIRSYKTYLKIQATIRREYFSSPVNCISYLITFLLLYLSVIQTMFTIIAYIRPHPDH